jgi:hypothetical protein
MNISINITYVSGTKVELVVPLEEPCQIVSEPESPVTPVQSAQDLVDAYQKKLAETFGGSLVDPGVVAEKLDKAIMEYKTSATFPSNKDLELTGKRYTSVQEMVDELKQDPESGRTMSLYDITYTTQDGKEWKVPPGLMKDFITIYGEKTVEQELWKAHAWIEADVHRRKTARGMGRYLNGWLSRASSMVRTPIKTLLKRDSLMTNGNAQESW